MALSKMLLLADIHGNLLSAERLHDLLRENRVWP